MNVSGEDLLVDVVITQWGLDSYLELKHAAVFSDAEYWGTIRPNVELLRDYPAPPEFANGKFWSPASDASGIIPDGFKMKWHQVGPGRVQLRLPVGMLGHAYLCAAYVKDDPKAERRRLAKFKTHLALIREGNFHAYGRLT